MAKDLNYLARRMEKLAVTVKTEPSRIAKEAALAGIKNLVFIGTPVDTSAALSNWQASIGAPKTAFIDPYVPGFLGYTANASAGLAYEEAEVSLATKRPGEVIHITNNTPYISALDSGSSKQAPPGLVDRGVMVIRYFIQQSKLNLL